MLDGGMSDMRAAVDGGEEELRSSSRETLRRTNTSNRPSVTEAIGASRMPPA